MLSEQSKLSITQNFHNAAKASLPRAPNDVIDIVPALSCEISEPTEHVLVITSSAFIFRLMTIFHFTASPASRAYFCGDSVTDQKLGEALSEVVNMFGGALNRELSHYFPHLAMSIPHSLSTECMKYLDQLNPQYLASYEITINSQVRLQVTLCMSCGAPVEIPMRAAATEEATGELEMF